MGNLQHDHLPDRSTRSGRTDKPGPSYKPVFSPSQNDKK
jgi:hypothetical protein